MPIYMDIFALCPRGDPALVRRFLDSIAPQRRASADDWFVGDIEFSSPNQAIDHCCANPQAQCSIYWSAVEPEHAHVHFLPHGMGTGAKEIDAAREALLDTRDAADNVIDSVVDRLLKELSW